MNLSFHIFSPKAAKQSEFYQAAYQTFKNTWSEEFSKLFGPDYEFCSNDFTRQDYIQALFLNRECIALDCIRKISLSSPADLDDSWLKPWKSENIQSLLQQGFEFTLVNSYFTVHRDHRKTFCKSQDSISYLMGCLSVFHQVEIGEALMLGMMRQDRSMNSLGKSWGSETIETGIIHNALPTDLVAFKIHSINQAKKRFPKIVFELFEQKNDLFVERMIHEKAG